MTSRTAPATLLFAWAMLLLGGCATSRYEPPPEVAPQPPAILAAEAVAEGQRAAGVTPTPDPATDPAPESATAPAATPVATTGRSTRADRFRPSSLSTQEIRSQNASAPMPLDFPQRLDYAHDRVYTWGQQLVEATDRRFAAKDEALKPVPAAPFRLGATLEAIDRSGGVKFDLDVALDAALQLPNIEERLRIFITSDELDSGPTNSSNDRSLRAGVRYELLRNLDFDLGVRVDLPPVAFASVKWSRQVGMGRWDFYPLAKLFIETKESFGYALGATFDRWSGRRLLRSSTYAKWRHDRSSTEWSHTLIYARANQLIVPDRYGSYIRADDIGRGFGVRALASGDHTDTVSRYEAGVFYHRQSGHQWLYWHVEPLVRWDRTQNWRADPGIRVGFNALFWDLARPAR